MRDIRKLATISLGFAAAIFVAHYVLKLSGVLAAAAVCLGIAAVGFAFKGLNRKRIILFFTAAAIGFAAYYVNYNATLGAVEPYTEKEAEFTARAENYADVRKAYSLVNVKLDDENIPNCKALVICYGSDLSDIEPGDELRITGKLRSAAERYNEETDTNISKGIYLIAYAESVEIQGRWDYSWLYFPQRIAYTIREQIREVFPEEASPFMLALLTGYKNEYYQNDRLYSAISVAGLSHVVAVSGMHIAFLVSVLNMLFGRNRRTSLLCIILIWLFVVTVGSPPSAVRAGIMLSLLLLAPVFKRENDAITTLTFALAVILASNPFSAGSVAIGLSFSATAGIILFAQPIYKWLNEKVKFGGKRNFIKSYIFATTANSVAVTVFTVPLVAAYFGYVNLLAAISNILCLWAISALFVLGFAACALSVVFMPLGRVLGSALAYLVSYVSAIAEWIASIPFAAAYTMDAKVVVWIVLTYLAFALAWLLGRKRKKTNLLVPCAVSLAALAAVFAVSHYAMLNDNGTVNVMDVGNGQSIVVTSGENAVVIDCGSYGTSDNAGNLVNELLRSNGRRTVDYLVLTHLHSDHSNGAVRLINMIEVKNLIVPDNYADTDADAFAESLLTAAKGRGVNIIFLSEDTAFEAGNIRLNVFASSERGKRSESGIIVRASIDDYDMLVTGDVEMSVERELVKTHDVSDTELLIVGHHGSKYSTSDELIEAAEPELAVISTGYNNYGHPTDEVLERLDEHEIETLRTDKLGRIEIKTSTGD